MDTQPSVNSSLFATSAPRTPAEWRSLEYSITDIFSPHAPIDDTTLFAGRHGLMHRVIDTVFQKGRHATLYGERGVGKTSLANIIKDQVFSNAATVKVIKRSCTQTHDFRLIWQHAFDDFEIAGQSSKDFIGPDVNPYDIYKIVELLPLNVRPVFIFDEFDRIRDKSIFPMMADTIKYLADYGSRATVIIVGVADNVTELFGGHPSIQRNVQQIKMPRMSTEELEDIFDRRMKHSRNAYEREGAKTHSGPFTGTADLHPFDGAECSIVRGAAILC